MQYRLARSTPTIITSSSSHHTTAAHVTTKKYCAYISFWPKELTIFQKKNNAVESESVVFCGQCTFLSDGKIIIIRNCY